MPLRRFTACGQGDTSASPDHAGNQSMASTTASAIPARPVITESNRFK